MLGNFNCNHKKTASHLSLAVLYLGEGEFEIYLQTVWHALRYERRGESLESFATLPTPIANRANRFGRATLWPGSLLSAARLETSFKQAGSECSSTTKSATATSTLCTSTARTTAAATSCSSAGKRIEGIDRNNVSEKWTWGYPHVPAVT